MLRRSIFAFRKPFISRSLISPFSSSTSNMSSPKDDSSPSTEPSSRNALPAPGSNTENVTTLDVSGSGTTVKLDALGPMVVNVDGTMSRISNWDKMADIEKENTLRIIGKRNQQRLAALRKARGISEGSNDSIGASGNHDTSGKQ
ncbi:hypothetical protein T069G_07297 [Trichoderma breve]|nr:hypothetical protein T069G_07297 [Trichoderma breve]KAJ4859030.1 hypothetical protein T069G_07297 [Trichoderma breve]